MKKMVLLASLISLLFSCKKESSDSEKEVVESVPTLEKIWETDSSTLITPEAVIFDTKKDVLYVSCINGVPPDKIDNDGYIAIVSKDGKIINPKWITGLSAPKGLGIFNDILYVTDINRIVAISIEEGKIIGEYPVGGSLFLNDITITESGVVFASDSYANRIVKLEEGKAEVWYQNDSLGNPNGLLAIGNDLHLVTFGSGEYGVFDIKTKEYTKKASGFGDGDGFVSLGKGFLVSGWGGSVHYLSPDLEKTEILNTRAEKINAADIWFNETEKTVYVPNFFANKVTAYKLK